jgi:hypothetical protein
MNFAQSIRDLQSLYPRDMDDFAIVNRRLLELERRIEKLEERVVGLEETKPRVET